ncbi:FAD-dependent oxidoreductase [Amycolatopsis samaneae]|uniref:FAD-dependent oxidoreductase n=1 Tax=Amycolatopsis samaneae TaxID=664691 RepID=A0ABW5GCG8_9PSEU
MRIAIAGAGLAGLSTAWLLDPLHHTVLFEPQERLGGHSHTVTAEVDGHETPIDLGAQHISPTAFPALANLLDAVGLTQDLIPVPLSTTLQVHDAATGRPEVLLAGPHTADPGWPRTPVLGAAAGSLTALVTRAAEWETRDVSWERSLDELIEPLEVPRDHKDRLLYPLLASFVGCDIAEAREMSARAAMAFVLRVPPASPDTAPLWHNLKNGLGSLTTALAADLHHGEIHPGRGVDHVRRGRDGLDIIDTRGHHHHVDRLVLAIPPGEAARLLEPLAGTSAVCAALGTFDYVDVTVTAHTDPTYLPADRRHWSTNTITVHNGWSETTTWYGPINGAQAFKSWTTHRPQPPREPLADATFRQLRLTPAAIRARDVVGQAQGDGGVHFAGHYLQDIDSQESALLSAIATTQRIAPDSPRLTDMLTRAPHASDPPEKG